MTEVELHIYIRKDGALVMSPENKHLLHLINESGSLLHAAKAMSISYNKAWKMLEAINSMSKSDLVSKNRGGANGGGAYLTEHGKYVLKEYELIEQQIQLFTKKLNNEINM